MVISPPTHLIFGRVIDIFSIFYLTKNQVRGLCVGGDMAFFYFFVILQSSYKTARTAFLYQCPCSCFFVEISKQNS